MSSSNWRSIERGEKYVFQETLAVLGRNIRVVASSRLSIPGGNGIDVKVTENPLFLIVLQMRFLRTPMKEMFYAYDFSQKILRRPEVSKR